MRILVLTDEIYPDAIGGVGKSVFNECVAWVRGGHSVSVLVRRLLPELPDTSCVEGIEVNHFAGPARHDRLYYLYFLSIFWGVYTWLRKHDATNWDIIYLQNALYILPVALSAPYCHTPIVFNFHSPISAEVEISAKRGKYGLLGPFARLMAALFARVEKWALRRSDHVVVDSEFMRRELQRYHHHVMSSSSSISTVSLGVDLSHYTVHSKQDARAQLGLPAKRPVLLTVRRLAERVGLPNLLEAMVRIRERHSEVLLLIGGQGRLRPTLEAMIAKYRLAENVHLLGFVREEELPILLAAADLFVLPTELLEGFGLATVEALAVGLPVIGTPVGATPEILAPIDSALLTHDASPGALADAVCYWLEHPRELAALPPRCRAEAESRYDIQAITARLVEIFENVRVARHKLG